MSQEKVNELLKKLPSYIKKIEMPEVSPYGLMSNDIREENGEIIIDFDNTELIITFIDDLQLVLTNSEWADATFRRKKE